MSFYSLGPSVQPSGTFDADQRRVVGYGYSGIAVVAPDLGRVFRIIEPFDVRDGEDSLFPTIRPVRVEPFDVLSYLGLAWGW